MTRLKHDPKHKKQKERKNSDKFGRVPSENLDHSLHTRRVIEIVLFIQWAHSKERPQRVNGGAFKSDTIR